MPVEWTVVCPRIKVKCTAIKTLRKNSKVKWPCGSSSPPARVSLSLALPSACFGLKPEKISIKHLALCRRRILGVVYILGVVSSVSYSRRCILGVVFSALYPWRCIPGVVSLAGCVVLYPQRRIPGVVFSALYPWRCPVPGHLGRGLCSLLSYS